MQDAFQERTDGALEIIANAPISSQEVELFSLSYAGLETATLGSVGSQLANYAGAVQTQSYIDRREIAASQIEQSFIDGYARGQASYQINSTNRLTRLSNQMTGKQIGNYFSDLSYERMKQFGTLGDMGVGVLEGFADGIYQGLQFTGMALAAINPIFQAAHYYSGNGLFNPFTAETHSFLDAPTTIQQAGGRQLGGVTSFFVGGEGILLAGAKGLSKANDLLVANRRLNNPALTERTVVLNSRLEQATLLSDSLPGLSVNQAQALLDSAFNLKNPAEVVIGGSRVRSQFGGPINRVDSDLDIGFNNEISSGQVKRILNNFDNAGELRSERGIRIVTGNKPKSGLITSPQDFFQLSGKRTYPLSQAGQPFVPSGYISINPNGTVKFVPPGR
ncbi:hypothetical protein KIH87_12695 [Paraneptunicella aestuarii]|uniref:hypothetical protein n=1 Tax=Paraneptunicella aestuarii TaxID=2831148 RepID=UPI001E5D816D|nr:hypothetical protein [Paraneptunicella aestuarii]UAA37567.1 hypothetical protein KIH87_12695 [Paraneptunicella aestuarii]